VILVGFYFGNDLFDAYRLVYGKGAWRERRLSNRPDLAYEYSRLAAAQGGNPLLRGHFWASRTSVLYRLAISSLRRVFGRFEMRLRDVDPSITVLADDDLRIAFTPRARLAAVDRS
jgi:hypothetical protein